MSPGSAVVHQWPETGFGEISGDVPEADFWPGMTFSLSVTQHDSINLSVDSGSKVLDKSRNRPCCGWLLSTNHV
jgi:hypothetical protein